MPRRRTSYTQSWAIVEAVYNGGFIVTESTLQAVLYSALRDVFPSDIHIVAEPTWEVGGQVCRPDLVMVENGAITDIFELKFVPIIMSHGRRTSENSKTTAPEDCITLLVLPQKPDNGTLNYRSTGIAT